MMRPGDRVGPGASVCDGCGELVHDIDAGFSPSGQGMAHDCGGTWQPYEHSPTVVTWQSPAGARMRICLACEARLKGNWPKDTRGDEYCQVSHGAHEGHCDLEAL